MRSVRVYLLAGVMVAVILTALASASHAADDAKITAVVLSVQHRAGATGAWAKSRVGTLLPAGSRVRTGKRSKCEIRFPDGSVVRMGPKSDMVIQAVTDRQMQLKYGTLWAKFISGSGARIQGGTAVAAIKGTTLDFTTLLNPDGTFTDFCTVYESLFGVDFTTSGGITTLMGGFGAHWHSTPAGGPPPPGPPPPGPQPPGQFGGGQYMPPTYGMSSGLNMQTTPGGPAGLNQKLGAYGFKQAVEGALPGTFGGDQSGDLEVIVAHAPTPHRNPATSSMLAMVSMPLLATTITESAARQASQPAELFGKRFFGPYLNTDLFGLWGEDESMAGVRFRPTAIIGDWYVEAGGTTWTDFDGNTHTRLSEAFAAVRPGDSEITIGRQHFLEGPVNNSDLGSIIGFDTVDAVRWQRQLDPQWRLDLGLVQDYLPFTNRDVGGYFGRAQTNVAGGMLGLNCVYQDDHGSGKSLDFSLPAVPGALDVYGEFGSNSDGRHVETWGIYFPELYQQYDLDLFVERASRRGERTLNSIVGYMELSEQATGVFVAQKSSGDSWGFSVGGLWEF